MGCRQRDLHGNRNSDYRLGFPLTVCPKLSKLSKASNMFNFWSRRLDLVVTAANKSLTIYNVINRGSHPECSAYALQALHSSSAYSSLSLFTSLPHTEQFQAVSVILLDSDMANKPPARLACTLTCEQLADELTEPALHSDPQGVSASTPGPFVTVARSHQISSGECPGFSCVPCELHGRHLGTGTFISRV
jgi:hypothetical protein